MMKSFFKKLAFVMALAMVVSMVAPAGSALAAASGVSLQGTKTIVETYELKVGDSVDFSFQGAPKDWKTTSFWTTSNEAVATVDKMGVVTAVAAGTATIAITAGADKSYSETVVITVPEEKILPEFTITQLDTVTVNLTFDEKTDLSAVTVDDFAVTAIDEMFEYTLFANTVAVNKNVVTLTFVEGVLSDGATIKIGFKGAENTLVASNGEVAYVNVVHGMNKKYTGDAYVYTELDPNYVLLNYKMYDANGIDVTANYEESVDYTIEWTLINGGDIASEPEEDAINGWQMSFDAKGAATVKTTVTFTDEDGEDRPVESAPLTIVAKNRPDIAFTYEEAGLTNFMGWKANVKAAIASFNNPNGSLWVDNAWSWVIGSSVEKNTNAWFAARLTDNRGKGLVSTQLKLDGPDNWTDLNAEGNTEYGDYGYFVYESSNEDVLAIDDEGFVTGVEVGAATILVSFVKYSEDGEELPPVKVCSKRITVTTDHPEPYAKTFAFMNDSFTITSTGNSLTATAYLKFYDQYGRIYDAFDANDLNTASVITVPSTYEDAANLFEFGDKVKAWYTNDEYAYPVTFNGADLNELLDIKDNGYSTFKFTVEFDKDFDDFAKVVTKNDKLSVKVYNVDEYYAKLTDFYSTTKDAATTDFVKWNWIAYGDASVDTYVDKRSEFDANSTGTSTEKSIGVKLYTAAGLELMHLPASHFIELTEKVDKINKKADAERNLVEGAIYYQINVPSKADPATYDVATGSAIGFTFNELGGWDGKEVKAATEGTYSVSLYYVNSKNKLVKLGSGAQSINVTNSTPAVKAEGFKESNVYDGAITATNISTVLAEMYNFTWNGELLYDADRDTEYSENFRIAWVEYDPIEADDTKVVITKVVFYIDYFADCVTDGEGGVNNNASGHYQTYELKKRITLKMD